MTRGENYQEQEEKGGRRRQLHTRIGRPPEEGGGGPAAAGRTNEQLVNSTRIDSVGQTVRGRRGKEGVDP